MRLTSILLSLVLFCTSTTAFAQSATEIKFSDQIHFDGVHFAPDGYLYFAGSWKGSAVFRGTPEGQIETYATGDFQGPTDAVMDSHGNLFVTNYNSTYVSKIAPDRTVSRFATTPQGPAGITIDADDNLYVTIYGALSKPGDSILKITPDGETSTYVQSPDLRQSVGIAMDDKGVLFVTSGVDARVFRIRKQGELELFSCLPLAFGLGGGAHLDWAAGELFATSGIGAVYRIAPTGAVHYILREGEMRSARGPAVSPSLQGANGITVTPDGKTLFLGCMTGNARTLIRVDREESAAGSKLAHGWTAINNGDFTAAEQIFQALTMEAKTKERAEFGIATVLYARKQYQEAGVQYQRAAKLPAIAGAANYNSACSFALAGDIDAAFEALDNSLQTGFVDEAQMIVDTDLASLHADVRWRDLLVTMKTQAKLRKASPKVNDAPVPVAPEGAPN